MAVNITQSSDRLDFAGLYKLLAWLVAISGCIYLLSYTITRQFFNEGPGLNPLSFLFFAIAFIALGSRQSALFSKFVHKIEPQVSRVFTVTLVAFVGLRIVESFWGSPFAFLTFLGGDAFETRAYASWGTSLGILLLYSIATYCPPSPSKALTWVSYTLFWAVVLISLHQLVTASFDVGARFLVPGVSVQSCFGLLCLAIVVFPRSISWKELYDPRTLRSNLLVTGILVVTLLLTIVEGAFLSNVLALELLSVAILVGLRAVAPVVQARDLYALLQAGRLSPDGELIEERQLGDMRPLSAATQQGLNKYFHDITFVKPLWVQDLFYATLVALIALGAIALTRTSESHVATFWPVNVIMVYWLFLNPVARWPRVLTYFYVTLLSVNVIMGNGPAISAMLTAVNAVEASICAVCMRIGLSAFVHNRLVHVTKLALGSVLMTGFFVTTSIIGSALLGGLVLDDFFTGSFLDFAWTWGYGSALAWFIVSPSLFGLLMTQHWGYPSLKALLRPAWLFFPLIWVGYWLILDRFAGIVGVAPVTLYTLGMLGLGLCTLYQAGILTVGLLVVFSVWISQDPDVLLLGQLPFLGIIIGLSLTIIGAYIVRQTQARTERERNLIARDGPSNVVTLDQTGAIVTCTEQLALMTGLDKAYLVGQNIFSVLQVESIPNRLPFVPAEGVQRWRVQNPRSSTRAVDIITKSVTDPTMPFSYICSVRDRTEALEAEEARVSLIEGSKTLMIAQDADWKIAYCSDGWCNTMGYTRDETIGKNLLDFFSSDTQRALNSQKRGKTPSEVVLRDIEDEGGHHELRTKGGGSRVIRFKGVAEGVPPAVIVTSLEDVTNEMAERAEKERAYIKLQDFAEELQAQTDALERSLKEQERLAETAKTYLEVSQGLYAIQNENFDVIQVSQEFLDLLGYQSLEDMPPVPKLCADDHKDLLETRKKILATPIGVDTPSGIVKFRTRDGRMLTLQTRSKWFPSLDGETRILVNTYEDITQLQEQADVLERQAETDTLTGVFNRLGLTKRLEDAESSWRERDWVVCLADIDWFKSVNDTYSHRVGDYLLVAVAKALTSIASEDGLIVRLGGEEFLLAEPWVSDEQAVSLGEKVRREIGNVNVLSDGHVISRTASVGVARLSQSDNLSDILHIADIALYEAKTQGRNTTVFANEVFLAKQRERGAFITDLDIVSGIEKGEFAYHVQPIYDTESEKIVGFETLVRWHRSDGTILPPSAFLERFQKIRSKTEYAAIRQGMRQEVIRALSDYPDAYVSFNFELDQFIEEELVNTVLQNAATLTKNSSHSIVLEISEHAMTSRTNFEALVPNLQKLRDAGIKIALDDFGSEQSNVYRLSQLPIDIVKLDRTLIKDIERSERDRVTLNGLVSIFKQLHIDVIAEGVETQTQAQLLEHAGVRHHQGFFYGKPMPLTDIPKYVVPQAVKPLRSVT